MSKKWAEKLANNIELSEEDIHELLDDCSVETTVRVIEPGDPEYEQYAALFEKTDHTVH